MPDIMIVTNVAHACQVVFDDPQLALAWLRTAIGQLSPESYQALVAATHPEFADSAKHMVSDCLGNGV